MPCRQVVAAYCCHPRVLLGVCRIVGFSRESAHMAKAA